MDVEQDDVGLCLGDQPHRLFDRSGVAQDLDESFELRANPRAEQRVVVNDDNGRRTSHARSYRARCGTFAHEGAPPGSIVSSTSVPASLERMRAVAAGAFHAPDDGLPDATAVLGHRLGVESVASVADEDLRAHRRKLGVDGDLAGVGRELGGVHHRFARGRRDERVARLPDRRVANCNHLDRHAVRLLDLGGRLLESRRQTRRRGRAVAGEQPAAKLALLGAGELRDGARVIRALLDERQRLKHGVVDVGGHLGAFL